MIPSSPEVVRTLSRPSIRLEHLPFAGIIVLDDAGAALEYAAIINDIRAAHGQDPIDFEGVPDIPAVDPVEGQITGDHSDVDLSFNWRAKPYDPIDELA